MYNISQVINPMFWGFHTNGYLILTAKVSPKPRIFGPLGFIVQSDAEIQANKQAICVTYYKPMLLKYDPSSRTSPVSHNSLRFLGWIQRSYISNRTRAIIFLLSRMIDEDMLVLHSSFHFRKGQKCRKFMGYVRICVQILVYRVKSRS